MTITTVRPLIRELAELCGESCYAVMVEEELGVEELIERIPEMVGVYVQGAALLMADWYNDQDTDSSYFAQPVDDLPDEQVENLAAWVHKGPQRPENRMKTATHSLVFNAARMTVYANALSEGVAVARYEYADSCDDCRDRATTSPRSRNSRSDDIATDFHQSCEGLLVPVRTGIWEPPSYAREWKSQMNTARRV